MKIPNYLKISTRSDLKSLIEMLSNAVKANKLSQFLQGEYVGETREPIESIPIDGPYPDIIYMFFRDTKSGKQYEVYVDTYHGSGGEWKLLDD